jgi:hypothetical protein
LSRERDRRSGRVKEGGEKRQGRRGRVKERAEKSKGKMGRKSRRMEENSSRSRNQTGGHAGRPDMDKLTNTGTQMNAQAHRRRTVWQP